MTADAVEVADGAGTEMSISGHFKLAGQDPDLGQLDAVVREFRTALERRRAVG